MAKNSKNRLEPEDRDGEIRIIRHPVPIEERLALYKMDRPAFFTPDPNGLDDDDTPMNVFNYFTDPFFYDAPNCEKDAPSRDYLEAVRSAFVGLLPEYEERYLTMSSSVDIPSQMAVLFSKWAWKWQPDKTVHFGAAVWMAERLRLDPRAFTRVMPVLKEAAEKGELEIPAYDFTRYGKGELSAIFRTILEKDMPEGMSASDDCMLDDTDPRCPLVSGRHEDTSSRRRFDALLSAIPEKDREKAKKTFMDLFWGICDYLMGFFEKNVGVFNAIVATSAHSLSSSEYAPPELKARIKEDFDKRWRHATQEIAFRLLPNAPVFTLWAFEPRKTKENDKDHDLKDLCPVTFSFDPFEASAGYILLADEGWGHLLNSTVKQAALSQIESILPWTRSDFIEDDQGAPVPEDMPSVTPEDLYRLYPEEGDYWLPENCPESAATAIFDETGAIPPLSMSADPAVIARLIRKGVPKETAWFAAGVISSINVEDRSLFDVVPGQGEEIDALREELEREKKRAAEAEKAAAEASEKAKARTADTEKELSSLRRELSKVKGYLHDADAARKEAEALSGEHEATIASMNEELRSLREAVYKLGHAAFDDGPVPAGDEGFPFDAGSRVHVYGGAEPWQKAMRELIPTASYFTPRKQVNENAVKSASVIFIQTAALSHSAYYKIISIAKMNQIPVHYFSSWNARMCASMMKEVLEK